ncbi:tyrosine-type recombinase/integrase [Vibrio breoganii]
MRKNLNQLDEQLIESSMETFSVLVDKTDTLNLTKGASYSESSLKAMASDWNRYLAFCAKAKQEPFTFNEDAMLQFLAVMSSTLKFSTVRRTLIHVSLILRIHGIKDPSRQSRITQCLAGISLDKNGDSKVTKALTLEDLDYLHRELGESDKSKDLRDLAMCYVMFECALNRKALRELKLSDVVDTSGDLLVNVETSSYRLSKNGNVVLSRYLELCKPEQGALFVRVSKYGNLKDGSLNDSSIFRVMRRMSQVLGYAGTEELSGNSCRVGAVQQLSTEGMSLRDIQAFGRWVSPVMPAIYLNMHGLAKEHVLQFKAIRLLDD